LDITEEEKKQMEELSAMREALQAQFFLVETRIENLRLKRKVRILEATAATEPEAPEGTDD
jgi:hypothetical protein